MAVSLTGTGMTDWRDALARSWMDLRLPSRLRICLSTRRIDAVAPDRQEARAQCLAPPAWSWPARPRNRRSAARGACSLRDSGRGASRREAEGPKAPGRRAGRRSGLFSWRRRMRIRTYWDAARRRSAVALAARERRRWPVRCASGREIPSLRSLPGAAFGARCASTVHATKRGASHGRQLAWISVRATAMTAGPGSLSVQEVRECPRTKASP